MKVYDPEDEPEIRDIDVATYYAYYEGWATRTYRIETGRCAGVLVVFSADKRGNRFPLSSRIAHAAIVSGDGLTNRP